MGASNSTRRIVVEEDEQQGAFLVQVSNSVTEQIYGGKEPAGRAAKKPVEPIHKAVEAAPDVKSALPIQAFPAIPLGPPSPEIAAAAVAAITAAPEPNSKPEEKPAPADAAAAAGAAAGVETEAKKPEDQVTPEASAVGAAEDEKKLVEEVVSTPTPDASAAAAAESSVDPAPVPPPKIPQSALLQLLTPSLPPPTEPEAPAVKEVAPATEESPAVKEEGAPVTPVTPPAKAVSEDRELLYKQMGEVYRERDKALRAIEDFYREKMNALQNQSTRMHSATRQEFNKAVEEVEKKFLKHVESPVAEELQLKVLECYRVNKAYPLKCSSEVQAFSSAVDQARHDVILAKKG